MEQHINRRGFLSGSVVAGASIAGFLSQEEKILLAAQANPEKTTSQKPLAAELPMAEIGGILFSRLIAGGNLLNGWCHQRDLLYVSELAQAYLTREKKYETLALMERMGINAIGIDMIQLETVKRYNIEYAGMLRTVVSVRQEWSKWNEPDLADLKTEIDKVADQGPDILYVHGGYCDRLVERGKPEYIELIGETIEYIRKKGFAAGLGSHSLHVPMECDKMRIEPDFYFKTMHHDRYWSATPKEHRKPFCVDGPSHLDHNEFHDNIFCLDADTTAAYMRKKKQPWIGFKVLAAGAIHPYSAFQFAFENGCDFICTGMFDFHVEQNVGIACKVIQSTQDRMRPWCA
ncbi:MAG: hypothetical protein JXA82_12085 [Sedimentisphaerales bacterium]|nr:hypothetical protein [Sedimentisphaerales bacterium]